jgi:hypothetical protein
MNYCAIICSHAFQNNVCTSLKKKGAFCFSLLSSRRKRYRILCIRSLQKYSNTISSIAQLFRVYIAVIWQWSPGVNEHINHAVTTNKMYSQLKTLVVNILHVTQAYNIYFDFVKEGLVLESGNYKSKILTRHKRDTSMHPRGTKQLSRKANIIIWKLYASNSPSLLKKTTG